ncbi:hypothetical protein V8E54_012559 [Elaphomyces granulatus]
MSFSLGGSDQAGRIEDYMDHHWPSIETSPFISVTHPYTTAHLPTAALTPISVPDSSFLAPRPSPAISHHSQEFQYQNIADSVSRHGLGITAPFPRDFLEASTSSFGLFPGPEIDYSSGHIIESSPPQRSRRPRRAPKGTQSARLSPVRILPHPDGVQRLEQERRQGLATESQHREPQRPRAAGRGRRDPQAEEEDAYVESLRKQNLSWKEVAGRFRERFNKDSTEARLQMRMLRRRKSSAPWHEADIPLLLRAYEYWQSEKYNIIAHKLQELGATRIYTEQQCEMQLQLQDGIEPESLLSAPPPRIPDPQRRLKRAVLKMSRRRIRAEDQ